MTAMNEHCLNCAHSDDDDSRLFVRCNCALSLYFDERVHEDNWCRFWSEKQTGEGA